MLYEAGKEFENAGFRFRVDGKHFEKGMFRKVWLHDNHIISLTELLSSNINPKLCLMKFEKHIFSFICWLSSLAELGGAHRNIRFMRLRLSRLIFSENLNTISVGTPLYL